MLQGSCPTRGRAQTTSRLATHLLLCLVILTLAGGRLSAAEAFKMITPEHITARRAKSLLDPIGLAAVSIMPGTDSLLITGSQDNVDRVLAVMGVIDRAETCSVRSLGGRDVLEQWTHPGKLTQALGNLEITDFSSQVRHTLKGDLLLDSYDGKTWLIAPESQIDRLATVIVGGPQALPDRQSTASGRLSQETLFASAGTPAASPVSEPMAFLADVPGPNESTSRVVPTRKEKVEHSHISTYVMPPLPNAEEPLNLKLSETLPITELLALVGQYLKLDYMYDPAEVQGEVTLRLGGELQGPLKVKHLYPLLELALKSKGLVMTRKDNLVLIVPESKVMDVDPELMTQGGLVEYGDVVLTRVFHLRHITTDAAQNLLDQMKLDIEVTPIPETKMLIVTAYAYRLPRIEQLLEMVDREGDPKEFRYRQLKYTLAKNLTEKVQSLAEQLETVSVSVSESQPEEITQRPGESDAAFRARRARELARRRAAANAAGRTAQASQPTSDSVYLDADERTNRILMIGRKDQLDIVESLVNSLDVEQRVLRSLKVYRIKYLDAEEVRNKLAELGVITAPTKTTTPAAGRITTDPRATAAQGTAAANRALQSAAAQSEEEAHLGVGGVLQDEPQVVVVEATNSLLIDATPEQHLRIAEIIQYLDKETELDKVPYVIYPLENQNPVDLAEVLEKLLVETIEDPEGKADPTKVKKTDEDIVIVPDENTFSLIVYANQRNQDWIKNLIHTLDKRRPQVLIEVSLVEISKNDEFNYDLNLIESFPDLTSGSGLTGAVTSDASGNILKSTSDILAGLADAGRDRFIDVQSNSGEGTAFYADRHINALLQLVEQKSYGRVMAKPKVLVNDNEAGIINTTDKTYVKKEGAIAGDQGAVQQTTDYEAYPTGVSLEITPHISEGDLLRLEIKMTRSDIKATFADGRPPDTTESNVETVVTVPDKSTIILGGLTKLNQGKGTTKVPLLGDLPLIGGLFRGVSNEDKQNHVYVFVKAQIIRPADVGGNDSDLMRISRDYRDAFEERESAFQSYQSWPGLKEQVITPERVLDAQ